jgi:hypothetical protein
MNADLQRARRALAAGRRDEATVYAWKALTAVTEEPDRAELFELAGQLDDVLLRREVEERGFGGSRPQPPAEAEPVRRRRRYLLIAVAALIIVGVAFVELPLEASPARFDDEHLREIRSRPESHARVLTLRSGVWLVPIERSEKVDLRRLADELTFRYRIPVGVQAAPVAVTRSTLDDSGDALVADPLLELLARAYGAEEGATVIGVTDYNVYSGEYQVYTRRSSSNYAIVSTAPLAGSMLAHLRGHNRHERTRKLIARDIEVLHLGLPMVDDPKSVRRTSISGRDDVDEIEEDS